MDARYEIKLLDGPSTQLRASLGRLSGAERRVGDALLADLTGAMHESVGQLAGRAGASPATVVRLARRLGYEGFAALKIAIAHEAGNASQFGHPASDPEAPSTVYSHAMAADAQSIRDAAQAIEPAAFTRAQDSIANASEVLFVGVGSSQALAALTVTRFAALGVRASTSSDALSQHLRAATLRDTDVCVAISHTGESRDTVDIAATARHSGAATVAVTSFAGSPLTEVVDMTLICTAARDTATRELFTNPVAMLSVLGALHAGVASLRPTSEQPATAARLITSHQY